MISSKHQIWFDWNGIEHAHNYPYTRFFSLSFNIDWRRLTNFESKTHWKLEWPHDHFKAIIVGMGKTVCKQCEMRLISINCGCGRLLQSKQKPQRSRVSLVRDRLVDCNRSGGRAKKNPISNDDESKITHKGARACALHSLHCIPRQSNGMIMMMMLCVNVISNRALTTKYSTNSVSLVLLNARWLRFT